MKKVFYGLTLLLLSVFAQAEITSKVIQYQVDGQSFTGYLAFDDSITGKRPGVLVVHEWWGNNDYARKRAEMLAGLGYTAFALDMYGSGKIADHPEDATKFMNAVMNDMPMAKKRFMAGYNLLRNQPSVNPDKIGAIGYCFGGGVVLAMAREGVDLDGVASFHGMLGTEHPAKDGEVKAKVAVFTGADDPMAPAKLVDSFKQEMKAANVSFALYSYPGVKHGFTNPAADKMGKKFDLPLAYSPSADADSWAKMTEFFKDVFAQE